MLTIFWTHKHELKTHPMKSVGFTSFSWTYTSGQKVLKGVTYSGVVPLLREIRDPL